MHFTDHLNGRIAHRVEDEQERLRLHGEIHSMFNRGDGAGLQQLVLRDPSLFFQPLPRTESPSGKQVAKWDSDWQRYGCWLAKACGPDAATQHHHVVQLALEAGAHPDDKVLFGGDVLLSRHRWRNEPKLLALALRHGASPDMPAQFEGEGVRSVVRQVLVELKSSLSRADVEEWGARVKGLIEAANMLLDAGAKIVDLPAVAPGGGQHPFASGLSILSERWFQETSPWVLAPMQALVRRLHGAGAALDVLCGYRQVPLVVFAVRNSNMPLALQLIELGAATSDTVLRRSAGPQSDEVLSLADEAEKWLGPEARAQVIAAVIRRCIAVPTAASTSAPSDVAASSSRTRGSARAV